MEIPAARGTGAMAWRMAARFILPLAGVLLGGCFAFVRPTLSPIPTLETSARTDQRSRTLVVFLPGRSSPLDHFESKGFVSALREAGANVDAISVDAHLGYYFNRTVVDRLQADVIGPARAKGYRRIVLVGLSLGGLGALLNERDHPGSVDAIILLAPYLGRKNQLFDEIAAAGGPTAWASRWDPRTGNIEEQLWTFLGTRSSHLPPTWLLTGTEDYLARGQQLFATLLPNERVMLLPGGHDWRTWTALWKQICAQPEVFVAKVP